MAPCESCHAGCCRAYAVPLTGADIITIQRRLQIGFGDFLCCWPDQEGRIARNVVPHFFFSEAPGTPFVICLKYADSQFFPETTKCRFLIECPPDEEHPMGQARCGIYSTRPSACRVFPTRFNSTGDLAILCDVPACGRNGSHVLYNLCPRPWEPNEIDPIQSVQDLAVWRFEIDFFSQIARTWNESPKGWNVFPDFLQLVYANRVQRDAPRVLSVTADDAPQTIPFPSARPSRVTLRAA